MNVIVSAGEKVFFGSLASQSMQHAIANGCMLLNARELFLPGYVSPVDVSAGAWESVAGIRVEYSKPSRGSTLIANADVICEYTCDDAPWDK